MLSAKSVRRKKSSLRNFVVFSIKTARSENRHLLALAEQSPAGAIS
jgi:hypothetical protein